MTAISAMSGAKLAMHHRRKRVNVVALSAAFGAMARLRSSSLIV